MKKKGSFLRGLVVFVLIIIILGGVGYLGFNIMNNAKGMDMASDTTTTSNESTDSTSTETASTNTNSTESSNQTTTTDSTTVTNVVDTYKIDQLNQLMLNSETLSKAYQIVSAALDEMTLDPYATDSSMSDEMNDQMNSMQGTQNSSDTTTQDKTTVNVYTGNVTDQQSMQMTNMGQTYDADKMQQLHSGLYKVSVGMQLLKQLQDDIALQIEKASVDTSTKTEYYMNQYYSTIANKNKLNNALTYINEAVDLININPYVDAYGLVYDSARMTTLHDSIYKIAQGVVDLNAIDSKLLNQAVTLGTLAQTAYNDSLQSQNTDNMNNMNMTSSTSGLNTSMIVTVILVLFVVIFIIGLIGSILNMFKSGKQSSITDEVN
jgi:hypothetical protein